MAAKKQLTAAQGMDAACILFELNSKREHIVNLAFGTEIPEACLTEPGALPDFCAEWRAFVHATVTAGLMQHAPNTVLVGYLRRTGELLAATAKAEGASLHTQAVPVTEDSLNAFVDGPFAAYMPLLAQEKQHQCPVLFCRRLGYDEDSRITPEILKKIQARLAAAVDDLQEQLPHSGVDGVAHQIGVQCLQKGLADEDLRCHSGGVGHTGAADGLHQRLLDDALLHVQGQFAGALLRSTPADAVGQTADILDFLGLNPLSFFRDGGRSVIRALGHRAHTLYFAGIDHCPLSFSIRSEFCRFFQSLPGILTVFRSYYIGKRLLCQGSSPYLKKEYGMLMLFRRDPAGNKNRASA